MPLTQTRNSCSFTAQTHPTQRGVAREGPHVAAHVQGLSPIISCWGRRGKLLWASLQPYQQHTNGDDGHHLLHNMGKGMEGKTTENSNLDRKPKAWNPSWTPNRLLSTRSYIEVTRDSVCTQSAMQNGTTDSCTLTLGTHIKDEHAKNIYTYRDRFTGCVSGVFLYKGSLKDQMRSCISQ